MISTDQIKSTLDRLLGFSPHGDYMIAYDLAILMFLYDDGEMTKDEYGNKYFELYLEMEDMNKCE